MDFPPLGQTMHQDLPIQTHPQTSQCTSSNQPHAVVVVGVVLVVVYVDGEVDFADYCEFYSLSVGHSALPFVEKRNGQKRLPSRRTTLPER